MFGPMLLYSMMHNTLKLIDQQIGSFDREKIEFVQHVAAGKKKASAEGSDVFQYLKEAGALEIAEKWKNKLWPQVHLLLVRKKKNALKPIWEAV